MKNLKPCAFVSRHAPTAEQIKLAETAGYCLFHVGDAEGFSAPIGVLLNAAVENCEAISCVHAGLTARAMLAGLDVLLWENATRPAADGKPQFAVAALHVMGKMERTFTRYTLD